MGSLPRPTAAPLLSHPFGPNAFKVPRTAWGLTYVVKPRMRIFFQMFRQDSSVCSETCVAAGRWQVLSSSLEGAEAAARRQEEIRDGTEGPGSPSMQNSSVVTRSQPRSLCVGRKGQRCRKATHARTSLLEAGSPLGKGPVGMLRDSPSSAS